MLIWLLSVAAWAQEPPSAVITDVHRSEVDVVTPYAAVLLHPAPAFARCLVRVVVEADGAPRSATSTKCEEPAASAAVAEVLAGRWRLHEGQVAPVAFVVPVEARALVHPDWIVSVYPELPSELPGAPAYTCAGFVGITEQGRVDLVHFTDCPEPPRAEVMRVMALRQAVPYVVDGNTTPVLDDFEFNVRPPDAPAPDRTIGADGVVMRHDELTVRRRVKPIYPPQGYDERTPPEVDCKVRIYIDEAGVPTEAHFEGCPLLFHASARTAVMRWRWRPAELNGAPVKAQFLLNIKYKK